MTGIDGAELRRGEALLWHAYGAAPVGIVDQIAILRRAGNRYQGRALDDGRVLWDADLGPHGGDTKLGALTQWKYPTIVFDERSGQPIGSFQPEVLAVARAGNLTAIALEDAEGTLLVGPDNQPVGKALGQVVALFYIGSLLVAETRGHALEAFRDGQRVWRYQEPHVQRITHDRENIYVHLPNWTVVVDPQTGPGARFARPRRGEHRARRRKRHGPCAPRVPGRQ